MLTRSLVIASIRRHICKELIVSPLTATASDRVGKHCKIVADKEFMEK